MLRAGDRAGLETEKQYFENLVISADFGHRIGTSPFQSPTQLCLALESMAHLTLRFVLTIVIQDTGWIVDDREGGGIDVGRS